MILEEPSGLHTEVYMHVFIHPPKHTCTKAPSLYILMKQIQFRIFQKWRCQTLLLPIQTQRKIMSRNFYNITLRNLQIQTVNLYLGCNLIMIFILRVTCRYRVGLRDRVIDRRNLESASCGYAPQLSIFSRMHIFSFLKDNDCSLSQGTFKENFHF